MSLLDSPMRPPRGFDHVGRDSQALFRVLLRVLSHPGEILACPVACAAPAPLASATAAVALALLDGDSTVWLDDAFASGMAADFLRFHTGVTHSATQEADFAIIADPAAMPALGAFRPGSAEAPEQGATLILQLPMLTGGPAATLRGPGIDGRVTIAPQGLPDKFWPSWDENAARFPRGVDIIMTDGQALLALPRSAARA